MRKEISVPILKIKITRKYYEQHYANKFYNFDEMDKFLEKLTVKAHLIRKRQYEQAYIYYRN